MQLRPYLANRSLMASTRSRGKLNGFFHRPHAPRCPCLCLPRRPTWRTPRNVTPMP
jgi:hypothetical protein